MKTCIISGSFPDLRCGVGDYTDRLSRALSKCPLEIYVITSRDAAAGQITDVDVRAAIKSWGFSDIPALIALVRDIRPDIVHVEYPTQAYRKKLMINCFPGIFKLLFPQTPLVVTVHDAQFAHFLNKIRLIPMIFSADKVVITVPEEETYLSKRFPFLKNKFHVIPLGSNIIPQEFAREERNRRRAGLGLDDDDVLITHFGFVTPKKKIETVFRSLRSLREAGCRAKLLMIGSFNPESDSYHKRLRSVAEELKISKYLIWAGYRTPQEVSQLLLSSDIAVQLYYDGISLRRGSLIAVLCHGLPVVSVSTGTLPAGLENYRNLITVPPGDTVRMVDAMKELVQSPDLRKQLGSNARSFSEQFNWDGIAAEHCTLYQQLRG